MVVDENTKIYVGDAKIEKIYQGNEELYADYPYSRILNYIQSTGMQYVDTLIGGDALGEYEIIFDPLSSYVTGLEQYFAGKQVTDNLVPKIYRDYNQIKLQQGSNELRIQLSEIPGVVKISILKEGIYINDVFQKIYTCSPWGVLSFYIFSSHEENNLKSSMRLYSLKMWSNGSLVRDFIPVLDKKNIPCLYDQVSKTLFYNKGTGTFLYE